jgi:hypothetical protein
MCGEAIYEYTSIFVHTLRHLVVHVPGGGGLQRIFSPYPVTMLMYAFCIKKLDPNSKNWKNLWHAPLWVPKGRLRPFLSQLYIYQHSSLRYKYFVEIFFLKTTLGSGNKDLILKLLIKCKKVYFIHLLAGVVISTGHKFPGSKLQLVFVISWRATPT